jgi:putative membrane protein
MRAVLAVLGVATLALVWLGPLPRSFAGHMTMHMGVVAVAAPLLALALAGSRADPCRVAPRLLAPLPASVVELLVVWGWHTPALHHAARHDAAAFAVEQGTFLVSGLWVWTASLGRDPRAPLARAAAGVLALLLTSMHMTLLGALLALPARPLYAHHPGPGALDDQHLGGAIMLVVGGAAYLAGGLGLTARLVRARVAGAPR